MRNQRHLITAVVLIVLLMAPVDLWLAPNYWIKSLVKICLFLLVPLGLNRYFKWFKLRELLVFKQKGRRTIIVGSFMIYSFIIIAYLTLGRWFDFSGVTETLNKTMAINKDNFIFVALYIPIVNAFVEEFFFRGFLFLTLKKTARPAFAYLFSASLFSFYHVAILTNWFSIPLFLLLVGSLIIAGLLFNWINDKTGSIYASYFIHAASNLAINTIGLDLFGLLPF
ncbi:CAAX prenyl protease-like protein [Streptohalobacillus salinus]|uniref:CAAX prenyl protease-like protein n=1 Tax=Streptohalobacillus salinus TaxID=621096 RepID=A0A2V3WF06_9BACI|nr:type II CAAX endopeptidase family protein [Streptohalobacillus salinus]PXW92735.1 CAAX prenyl protease-like protein [Streptohalobacillus salinus]